MLLRGSYSPMAFLNRLQNKIAVEPVRPVIINKTWQLFVVVFWGICAERRARGLKVSAESLRTERQSRRHTTTTTSGFLPAQVEEDTPKVFAEKQSFWRVVCRGKVNHIEENLFNFSCGDSAISNAFWKCYLVRSPEHSLRNTKGRVLAQRTTKNYFRKSFALGFYSTKLINLKNQLKLQGKPAILKCICKNNIYLIELIISLNFSNFHFYFCFQFLCFFPLKRLCWSHNLKLGLKEKNKNKEKFA